MDLLGDIGTEDQLTSARAENAVLRSKVKELTQRVRVLSVENESLRAEVEMYRSDVLSKDVSNLNIDEVESEKKRGDEPTASSAMETDDNDKKDNRDAAGDFVRSGNGVYPNRCCSDVSGDSGDAAEYNDVGSGSAGTGIAEVNLPNLHGASNPLCCALSPKDDAVLATGGADSCLSLCRWESVPITPTTMSPESNIDDDVVVTMSATSTSPRRQQQAAFNIEDYCTRINCDAPVITAAFSPVLPGIVAAGCMDGSAYLYEYSSVSTTTTEPVLGSIGNIGSNSGIIARNALRHMKTRRSNGEEDEDGHDSSNNNLSKHGKYVKGVAWSPRHPILATSSADGCIYVYKFKQERNDVDLSLEITDCEKFSLHLPGPVESMCFTSDDHLLCYARGTPHLSYFDLNQDFQLEKVNLNANTAGSGAFDDHVSYTIMDMKPYREKYLAAATDTSRNIVFDLRVAGGGNSQVRNLYGHKNDGFSQPKVAWSQNGQYLLGNTQDDRAMVVWDVASSQIVEKLEGHTHPIRDIYSSPNSNTVVTTAFDKQTKFWFHHETP